MEITIRAMKESDAGALHRLLSDPAVMRYLETPFDREKTEDFLRRAGMSEQPLVYAAEKDGSFVGYVIYHAYDERSVEIGWVLLPEYWGQGLACALTDRLTAKAGQEGKDAVIEGVPEQRVTKHIARKKGFIPCASRDGLEVYRLEHQEKN